MYVKKIINVVKNNKEVLQKWIFFFFQEGLISRDQGRR